MAFENLAVQRLILHEVFKRRDDGRLVPPRYGGQLLRLPAAAMDAFRERVVDALGNNSQSMEMDIVEAQAGSAVELSSTLLGQTDHAFVTMSQVFADKLANAQSARNWPGGIVIVFAGTVGAVSHHFVGVIKAETQTGFKRDVQPGLLSAQYFDDLFLTPAAKLYKIGVFIQHRTTARPLPKDWKAFVYDSQMSSGHRDGAARYFFGSFLGCEIPTNSAALTKSFFENTREFIQELDVPPGKKNDLLTSLYTYLKVDQTPTIEVNAFSTAYIPVENRDNYRAFMEDKKFPLTAVVKDIADIGSALKLQRVGFRNNIRLTAPPEAFRDLISIEALPQKHAGPGEPSTWTRITIRDQISEQE